jgi:hypothetical protein
VLLIFAQHSFQRGDNVLFPHCKHVWTQPWTLRCTHQHLIERLEEGAWFYAVIFGYVEDSVLDFVWVVFGLQFCGEFGDGFLFFSG